MKRILINGAGGFIGRHLVETFLRSGYQVRASDIASADLSWAQAQGVEIVHASLDDPKAIEKSVQGTDMVVHSAAIFNLSVPRNTIVQTNVDGTRHYCKAAVKHNVERFVFFSTSGIYGVPKKAFITEDGAKNPRNPYEESKWLSEQCAMSFHKKHGLPVVAIRPTLVYGPGSRYGQALYLSLFSSLKCWGIDSLYLPRGGKINHQVHVTDVCQAVKLLAETNAQVEGDVFNVADREPTSAGEIISCLGELTGIDIKLQPALLNTLLSPGLRHGQGLIDKHFLANFNKRLEKTWPRIVDYCGLKPMLNPYFDSAWLNYLWADHSYSTKKLRHLGWEASVPSFQQGMPATLQWYREQRWLPTVEAMANYAANRKARKLSKSPA